MRTGANAAEVHVTGAAKLLVYTNNANDGTALMLLDPFFGFVGLCTDIDLSLLISAWYETN